MKFNPTVIKGTDVSVPVSVFVLRKLGHSAWEVTGFMSDILVNGRPAPSSVDLLELLLHLHDGQGRLPRLSLGPAAPSAALGL